MGHLTTQNLIPLNIAVLTVSDTRDESNDTSGQFLIDGLLTSGHQLTERTIVKDDIYAIRAKISSWIADDVTHAILITGGTGFTSRDSTPEAVTPLLDKVVEGFGELFRAESFKEIGTSTVQSRAVAGLANNTIVFCMPGSTGACRTAWNGIISGQLDSRQGPCNFVPHLKNIDMAACLSRE
ncbi:MAG: molybdenum cofactor biosynthesis protein B [Agarilytica sp.]